MTVERWQYIKELFESTRDAAPEQRERALAAAKLEAQILAQHGGKS